MGNTKPKEKSLYKAFGGKVSVIPWNGKFLEIHPMTSKSSTFFLMKEIGNYISDIDNEGYKQPDNDILTIEASVVTGFEGAAQEEVKTKLGITNVKEFTGRVLFDIESYILDQVLNLRTVDNVWIIIGAKTDFDLTKSEEECTQILADYTLNDLLWTKGLSSWNKIFVSINWKNFEFKFL